jgi:4-hydroxybenzoate polyprenyltransferase
MSLPATIKTYGQMVRFSHSIFALPFALAGAAFAAVGHGLTLWQLGWIIVAMVAARNAAMGFNPLPDQDLDAANPRTSTRELPRGLMTRRAVWVFVTVLSALFILSAGMLNPLCLALSPVALAVVFLYSYTKRFTWATQFVLGLALAIAPVGGWLAVRGAFGLVPLALAGAVLCWVAGFDIIYACQDVDFDRRTGLHSIPARFGIATSLWIARGLHGITVVLLLSIDALLELHVAYLIGVGLVGICLIVEHALVRSDDLSRVNLAFFTANGIVSLLYLAAALAGIALRS